MSASQNKNSFLTFIKLGEVYYSLNYSDRNISKSVIDLKKTIKFNLLLTNNNFIILPHILPESLKKVNIRKTLGVSNIYKNKIEKINDLSISYFYKKNNINDSANKINHISHILLNEFINNNKSELEIFISFFNEKIFITVLKNKSLLFYNQFEYKNSNFIKYILLTLEEYNIDRVKTKLNIIGDNHHLSEMKNFFGYINLYKKSIFDIIENFYG